MKLHITDRRRTAMATLEITKSIDIDAPVEKVWAALTEPKLIAEWFGDRCEFDARPGGKGLFGWTEHGAESRVTIEHVDRPKTLIYRWAHVAGADPAPGNSTVVRFDLAEIASGTRLSLLETGFEELDDPAGQLEGNTGGWDAELGELVAFVESR
jgi:uncharacterized protein YndB with AHSA1/START domain